MVWETFTFYPMFAYLFLLGKSYSSNNIVRLAMLILCELCVPFDKIYLLCLLVPELYRAVYFLILYISKTMEYKEILHNNIVQFFGKLFYNILKVVRIKNINALYSIGLNAISIVVSQNYPTEIVPVEFFDNLENSYIGKDCLFLNKLIFIRSMNDIALYNDDYTIVTTEFDCPVCLTKQTAGIKLTCGHEYCEECFKKWYIKKDTCPLCRDTIG
jgi:hypothetical protein